MKKRILCFITVLAIILSSGMPVLAVSSEGVPSITDVADGATVEFQAGSTEKLKVTYAESGIRSGGSYLILVVKAEWDGSYAVSESSILYIDQVSATEAGKVEFTNVYPSSIRNSVVMISGTGLSGPVKLATISVPYTTISLTGGKLNVGESVTCTVDISNINAENLIWGADIQLTYDSNNLRIKLVTAEHNDIDQNRALTGQVTWAGSTALSREGTLFSIVFEAVDGAVNGSYTVSMTKAEGEDTIFSGAGGKRISDDSFKIGSAVINIVGGVDPDTLVPVITDDGQPKSAVYSYGENAPELKVSASAETEGVFSYQWYRQGVDGAEDEKITGATSAAYIPGFFENDTVNYYCVVTNTYHGLTFTTISNTAAMTYLKGDPVTGNGANSSAAAKTESGGEDTSVENPSQLVQTTPAFTDVPEDAWYYDAVNAAVKAGLFSGVSENRFDPEDDMTRAMLVTVLWRMCGEPSANTASTFIDVFRDSWYTDAVDWANSVGVVYGMGNGLFGTDDNITREQLAVILYRCAQLAGLDTTARADLGCYADADMISSYAEEAMSWAVGAALISGVGNDCLDPGGSATRAQAATILIRFRNAFGI